MARKLWPDGWASSPIWFRQSRDDGTDVCRALLPARVASMTRRPPIVRLFLKGGVATAGTGTLPGA
jgi:hypothetical protein